MKTAKYRLRAEEEEEEMRMRKQGIMVRRLIPDLNSVQTQIKHIEALIEVNNKKSKKVTKSVAPIKATGK